MKTFFVVFLIFISQFCFSQNGNIQYNYANGNGTILSQTNENGYHIIIRKHEDRFSIEPSSMRPYDTNYITAYEEPNVNSRELFTLNDGTYVNTLQVAFINNTSYWVKIRTDDNKIGWLDMDNNWDYYSGGIWSIIEIITTNNRNWTIRKLDGHLSVFETLNVRNNPGVNSTRVLFQLIPTENNPQLGVTILAITEETDTIDGITDYWVKIKDENNRIGWVFGGYTSVERGGPKYYRPMNGIRFSFNLP